MITPDHLRYVAALLMRKASEMEKKPVLRIVK